jgi:hypothetical protein
MEHCKFEFLIFVVFGSCDVTWDCPKRKVLGGKGSILKHVVLGRRRGAIYGYFYSRKQ